MRNDESRPNRGVFTRAMAAACFLGIVWLSLLLWMTVTYANPVTLNLAQIEESDYVVEGQFDETGELFLVSRTWPENSALTKIRLTNSTEIQHPSDGEYLVPVKTMGGRYFVTPSQLQGKPLIYPATEDALRQLEGVFNARVVRLPRQQALRD